jgi:hypothetical protein
LSLSVQMELLPSVFMPAVLAYPTAYPCWPVVKVLT